MDERMITTPTGVEICTQAFGDPADIPTLLIMGAGASMVRWDERFIGHYVGAGRYAIRFDNRDTGRSSCCPVGEPDYTLRDMADDAIAVLDAYDIETAHVMGRSMGGMITQHVVLDHPKRVRTATLLYSTPSPGVARAGGDDSDLPGTTEALRAVAARAPEAGASEDARREHMLDMQRVLNGSRYPLDVERTRELARTEIQRARNYDASGNHGTAIGNSAPWRHRLGEIDKPTLVVHGTEDPILQFPHGEALVREIKGAELMVLEGVGHALPEPIWNELIERLVAHTAQGNN